MRIGVSVGFVTSRIAFARGYLNSSAQPIDFAHLFVGIPQTWEGWLYLAVVIDLHSRMVVGWSMKATLARELVLDAVLMAVWKRKPRQEVIVHSDQGCQYGSDDWQRFCRTHNLVTSMSRRGNCWDNAVAESFFSSL